MVEFIVYETNTSRFSAMREGRARNNMCIIEGNGSTKHVDCNEQIRLHENVTYFPFFVLFYLSPGALDSAFCARLATLAIYLESVNFGRSSAPFFHLQEKMSRDGTESFLVAE